MPLRSQLHPPSNPVSTGEGKINFLTLANTFSPAPDLLDHSPEGPHSLSDLDY